MKIIKNIAPFLIIIALSFWVIKPLFVSGFFPMHDDEQVGRLYELNQAIRAGHIPPRIVPNLGFGYGYPFFNFYPPFAYYVAEIFKILGFSYILSIKLMIGLGFILAGICMYIFCKEYLNKLGSIVAAVAYTYTPYHALDVYVRGALPEFWSFVFLPLIFWSYTRLHKTGMHRYIILAGIFCALLILTHNLVAMMSSIFILIYLLFLLKSNKDKKSFIMHCLISLILALSLSAYFWIPSFFEKKYTLVDILTKELADYKLHFVYIRQFWNSQWGYGGSIYGLMDGISFEVGKVHIVVGALVFAFMLYFLKNKEKKVSILFVFFILFFISLFLSTFHSQFIWSVFPSLWYIQFPWRFLIFATFTISFLTGAITLLPMEKSLKMFVASIILVFIIVFNKDYFQPFQYLTHAMDKDYTSKEKLRWSTSRMAFEYVPKGIATVQSDIGTTQVDIDKNSISKSSYEVVRGQMKVEVARDDPHIKKMKVEVFEPSIFRINTYSFPGWKVFIDKNEVAYSDTNKLRLITIDVPAGVHEISAEFTDTFYRRLGNYLTIASIIILASVICMSKISDIIKSRAFDK